MSQPPTMSYAAKDDYRVQTLGRRLRRAFLRRMLWAGLGVAMLLCFVGLFEIFQRGIFPGLFALIACAISTTIAAGCLRAARRRRAMTILIYCEQGVRLALPLPEFLRAVAMSESPRMARRLLSIVRTLEAPAMLGDALRGELPELPSRVSDVLRSAETNGTLVTALSRVAREEQPDGPNEVANGPMPLAYIAIMTAGLMLPTAFITFFVMPKMTEIMRDFGVTPPRAWSFMYTLDPLVVLAVAVVFSLAGMLALLCVLSYNARWIFFRKAEHDQPLKTLVDRVVWHLPVVGTHIRNRDWSDVCQTIADGLDQHRPLDVLVRDAASPHLNSVVTSRLDHWGAQLQHGEAPAAAARAAWLPDLISGLIGNGTSDALAPTFAFLARHYRARALERGAWLRAAVMPVLTLIAGAMVLGVALFVWIPICAWIDHVTVHAMRL